MKEKSDNHELLLRYLLGELTELEHYRVENRCFAEDELYEEMLLIEDDLIESYARDELSDDERSRMEKHFLKSGARRERVIFERALIKCANESPSPARPEGAEPRRVSWWRYLTSLFRFAI